MFIVNTCPPVYFTVSVHGNIFFLMLIWYFTIVISNYKMSVKQLCVSYYECYQLYLGFSAITSKCLLWKNALKMFFFHILSTSFTKIEEQEYWEHLTIIFQYETTNPQWWRRLLLCVDSLIFSPSCLSTFLYSFCRFSYFPLCACVRACMCVFHIISNGRMPRMKDG